MCALFFILPLLTFVSSQELVCREGTILNNTQCTPDPSKCNLLKAAYNGCCITTNDVAIERAGICGSGTTEIDDDCELSSNNNVEDCGALKRAYNKGKCCGHSPLPATNASDIDCTFFGQVSKVLPNEELLLMFYCTPTSYTYTLKIDPPLLDNSLITTHNTFTRTNVSSILVKPNTMEAHSTYIFTINVTGSDGGTTIMSENIVVTGPPREGTCTVNPNSGTAIDTEFTISCSAQDNTENYPLTYQFFYSTGGVVKQLSGESWTSTYTFKLPAGDPNNENQLQIVAKVANKWGLYLMISHNITVNPAADAADAADAALGDELFDPSNLLRL
jgi:hypothetical protein